MPHASRPGDVLADRYRLVDLLTESRGGRFWRAYDRVLERHVALHVIHADDDRAPGLTAAARRSATVLDPHVLRVLDADTTEDVCYVVNEWGWGTSLDIVVGAGPLGARRAAWLVAEVATAVATAHAAGVAHGRLIPENVLIDRAGGIRLIGLCVDAALHGLPPDRRDTDVADLAGLLYCALTGVWPGPSESIVPPAPREHGAVIRPRRVRAGVPRSLDVLCEDVLNPRAGPRGRDQPALQSASAIATYLSEVVGDPTGLAAALVAGIPDVLPEEELVVLPPVPEMSVHTEPVAELSTEAGIPIFGEDDEDVSWLQKRSGPSLPPPPFEEPPQRPLFAPDPADGGPTRRTRVGAGSAPRTGEGFWPWESAPPPAPLSTSSTLLPVVEGARVPGRRFLRLASGLAVILVVVLAVLVSVNLGRGKTVLGGDPAPSTPPPSTSATSTAPDAVLSGVTARFFDPQGDHTENDADAPLAVDGRPATSWSTVTYDQQLGPGGLKDGVGLLLDLGETRTVTAVDLTFVGSPTAVSIYLTATPPTGVSDLQPVASGRATRTSLMLEPRRETASDAPSNTPSDTTSATTGRYVVVWLTELPEVDGAFRGGVTEISIQGH